ncbi:c-type cytochrome [Pantoea sp. Ap-967]|uniref:c-type cytochrome n=1 Tax=Pantoea sp. Ap-967 TaxID=2608362 RepID=UPI00141D932F|nr:cytochrome c [Pantoea sp. Ap-967]NIE73576.1 c-type cytochrome [Pantoea sp. Ap-967]
MNKLTLPLLTSLCLAISTATLAATDDAAITRGEYLARAGDCMACHTAKGGKPYAGGLGLETPIGTVYATNISPDPVHGIGGYTLAEFDQAVRHGIRKDGSTLYPAMPYPSYAKVTDQDIADLYAYFMKGVQPVVEANRDSDIPWPMNMRWPLAFWRWTFAQQVTTESGNTPDPQLERGRYLVNGLGHCGSCHTPRGIGMQEKSLSDSDGDHFLAGGAPLEGWVAKNLRGDLHDGLGSWSTGELAQFLKTGRTERTAVFGSMTDVIQHSMQHLTDSDRLAIARYLKSLPAKVAQAPASATTSTTAAQLANMDTSVAGARTYIDNCMACHRSDGRGYAEVFPALAGNSVVNGQDATSLIHIVLAGGYLPGNQHAPTGYGMPDFAWRLSDQEVADVVSFIRKGWSNQGGAVTENDVAKQRRTLTKN